MASLLSPLADLQGLGSEQSVWGIDPSTWRFSVGIVRPEEGAVVCDSFERGDGWAVATIKLPRGDDTARRLASQREVLTRFLTDLKAATGEPVFVLLETPFSRPSPGRNSVHPESFYAVGVGALVLAEILDCPIDLIGPSEWKLPALGPGRGNSKKPQILQWAREEIGYPGECASCGNVPGGTVTEKCEKQKPAHDEADAIGLAVAAARRLAVYGREI